jgi:hypothetical protein
MSSSLDPESSSAYAWYIYLISNILSAIVLILITISIFNFAMLTLNSSTFLGMTTASALFCVVCTILHILAEDNRGALVIWVNATVTMGRCCYGYAVRKRVLCGRVEEMKRPNRNSYELSTNPVEELTTPSVSSEAPVIV